MYYMYVVIPLKQNNNAVFYFFPMQLREDNNKMIPHSNVIQHVLVEGDGEAMYINYS